MWQINSVNLRTVLGTFITAYSRLIQSSLETKFYHYFKVTSKTSLQRKMYSDEKIYHSCWSSSGKMLSHANRNWFTITCLSYLISNSELCKLFWTCSLFVGVTMISMATERSVFQTICAITTMAVATQRYVNLKCFCFRKSNDLFLKLIFTVLFKLYIQIKSFIYISTKKISRGWSHDQDQSITILRPSFCWFLGQT